MASLCKSQQCSIERRGFRQELDSWRHKLIHCLILTSEHVGIAGPAKLQGPRHSDMREKPTEERDVKSSLTQFKYYGFESILEGLFGPGLLKDLSLFKDCEPEAVSDWSFDENCLFCCLRREKVKEYLIGLHEPTSEAGQETLRRQEQAKIIRLEKQAEEFLNAVFYRKDSPRVSNPNIPLVAREIMQRMIRQFAAEYTSKTSSTQDSSQPNSTKNQSLPKASPTQTSPSAATSQNPVLSKLLMADQDTPLDLTVRKSEPSEQDGVLDLSTKKSPCLGSTFLSHSPSCSSAVGNGEETSQTIEIESTTNQPKSALEKFMIRLCSHHQKQFIHVLNDLCTERYNLPDTTSCMSNCNLQSTSISDTDTNYSTMKSSSLSELHQEKSESQGSACVGTNVNLEHSLNHSAEQKYTVEGKCSSSLVKDNSSEVPARTSSTQKFFSAQQCVSLPYPSPNYDHISEDIEQQTAEQVSMVKKYEEGNNHTQNKSLVKCLTSTNVMQMNNSEDISDCSVYHKNSLRSLPEALSNFTASLQRTVNSANTLQHSTKAYLHEDLKSAEQDVNLKQENIQHLLGRNKSSNHLLNGETNPCENSKDWLASSPYSGLNKTSSGHTRVKSNSTTIKATRKCKRASGLRINDYDNQCDVVYISQPITECHLENQRSLISLRKTARKSTRGYFFNGECCELPTVRTLVKSPTSVPETIIPNQILVVPGILPTGQIPVIGNPQEIDGVQAPLKLSLQGTPFSKEKLDETVVRGLELPYETSQANPLLSKGAASVPLTALLSLVHGENSKEGGTSKSKIITYSSPSNKKMEKKIEQLEVIVGVSEDINTYSENTIGKHNSKTVECVSACLSEGTNREGLLNARPPSEITCEEKNVVYRPASLLEAASGENTVDSTPVSLIICRNQEKIVNSRLDSPQIDGNQEESVSPRSVCPIKDGKREASVDSRPGTLIKNRNLEGAVDSIPESSRTEENLKGATDSTPKSPRKDRNPEWATDSSPLSPIKDSDIDVAADFSPLSPIKDSDIDVAADFSPLSPVKEGDPGGVVDFSPLCLVKDSDPCGAADFIPLCLVKDGDPGGAADFTPLCLVKDGDPVGVDDFSPLCLVKDGDPVGVDNFSPLCLVKDGDPVGVDDFSPLCLVKDGDPVGVDDFSPCCLVKDCNPGGATDFSPLCLVKDRDPGGAADFSPLCLVKYDDPGGAADFSPLCLVKDGDQGGAADFSPLCLVKDGDPDGAADFSPLSLIKDGDPGGAADFSPLCLVKDCDSSGAADFSPLCLVKDGDPGGAADFSPVSPVKDGDPEGADDSSHNNNVSTEDTVNKDSITDSAQPSVLAVGIRKETILGCMSLSKIINEQDFHDSKDVPQFLKSSMGTVDLSQKVNIAPEKKVTLKVDQTEKKKIVINSDLKKISENKIPQKKIKQTGKRKNSNLSTRSKNVKAYSADRNYGNHNVDKKKKKGKNVSVRSDRCLRSQQCQSLTTCIKKKPVSSTFKLPCLQIELFKNPGGKRYKKIVRIRKARYVHFPIDCFHKTWLKNIWKKNIVIDFEGLIEENIVATQQFYKPKITQENNRNREGQSQAVVTDTESNYKSGEKLEVSVDTISDERKIYLPKAKTSCREQAKKKPRDTNMKYLESSVRNVDSLTLSQKAKLNSTALHNTRNGVKPMTSRNLLKHKKLALRSYNLRHSPAFENKMPKKHLGNENIQGHKKTLKECALENEDAIDLKNVNAHEDSRPKFVDWCAEEENQELIADFNAKYIKIQKGWIQLEKETQPVHKTKTKYDKLKEIWRTKKRVRKNRNSLEVQKLSPIQMLFMKPFKLSNICKWFLETTETRSLVIVKKLNTRIPGELPVSLIPLQKYSSSNSYPHSLQAERLKKHLKKFPGATPLRNNCRTQNLWAKFRDSNNKAVTESSSEIFISANSNSDEHTDFQDTKSLPSLKPSANTQILKKYSTMKGKLGTQYSLVNNEEKNETAVDQEKVEPIRKSVCINPLMSPKLALQVKADAFSGEPRQIEEKLKDKKGKKRSHEDLPKTDVQLNKKKKVECDDIDIKDASSSCSKEKLPVKKANKVKHLESPSKAPTTRKRAAMEGKNKLSLIKKNVTAVPRKCAIKERLSIQKAKIMKKKRQRCAASRQPVTKSPKQRTRKSTSKLLKEMEKEKHSIKTRSLKNEQNTVALKKRKLRTKFNPTQRNRQK
uniref:Ligand-dependent corepressor isoform X2 n=1 Tax=Geotrypetes seraphini TaxID=260995 RepID=A0A6P8RE30_GEOSA|nr:ligand-dependent corepressor isoform X2 [Geotrypetes seraphini]